MKTLGNLFEDLCAEKLVYILRQRLECLRSDREQIDWQTARDFVERNPAAVVRVLQAFVPPEASSAGISWETPVGDVPFEVSRGAFHVYCAGAVFEHLYAPLEESLLTRSDSPYTTPLACQPA